MKAALVTSGVFAGLLAVGCGGSSGPAKASAGEDSGVSHDAGAKVDAAPPPLSDAAGDGIVGPTTIEIDASLSGYAAVLAEAKAILAQVKQTTYAHQTFIDESTGTFDVDCSGFTNFVIQQAVPSAFATLVKATTPRPVALGYATFLAYLPAAGSGHWHPVAKAASLVPGDIIAWIEPKSLGSADTGHTMITAATPTEGGGGLLVNIIDSTLTGHGSSDVRTDRTTGVGQGTIVLIVDDAGAPTGYRWSTDPGDVPYSTTVGLGHLE